MSRRPAPTAIALAALLSGGCALSPLPLSAGRLQARTIATVAPDGVQSMLVMDDLQTAIYEHQPGGDTSLYASDISVEDLLAGAPERGQVLHVELLWEPRAGATPMDRSATNVSLHYAIFVDGEMGVYAGAGFGMPAGRPGDARLTLDLRDSTVRLVAATEGYVDRLGTARITGRLVVRYEPRNAERVFRAISQRVTNGLGRSTWF